MADFNELLPDILPHVRSCPGPSITRALQWIGQDFYQRSEAYTHEVGNVTVQLDDSEVTIILPTDARLVVPLVMYLDGERLSTTNEDMLALQFGDWRAQSGVPKFVMVDDEQTDKLILALPSDGEYTLTGKVALKPTRTATTIPDNLFEIHGNALVDGALYRLLMMKNTEWYDPKLASYHRGEYELAIDAAYDAVNKGNTSRLMVTGYGGI